MITSTTPRPTIAETLRGLKGCLVAPPSDVQCIYDTALALGEFEIASSIDRRDEMGLTFALLDYLRETGDLEYPVLRVVATRAVFFPSDDDFL